MAFSDRGYVLENGVVELEGTSEALAKNPEVRRSYLGDVIASHRRGRARTSSACSAITLAPWAGCAQLAYGQGGRVGRSCSPSTPLRAVRAATGIGLAVAARNIRPSAFARHTVCGEGEVRSACSRRRGLHRRRIPHLAISDRGPHSALLVVGRWTSPGSPCAGAASWRRASPWSL